MRHPAALATVTGLTLGLALACGGLGSGSDPISSYRGPAYEVPEGAAGYPALDRAYRVPPDRASVAVTLAAQAPDAPGATAQLTSEIQAISAAVGDRCTASLLDAFAPAASGSEGWTARGEVRVDVDLRGLTTVEERRARIDACLAGIEPLVTRDAWSKVASGTRQVQRSAVVLSVEAPERHRDALLERARADLSWAAAASGAPQLHPGDLRCVPDGTVLTGDQRLSGVELRLGMPCRVAGE